MRHMKAISIITLSLFLTLSLSGCITDNSTFHGTWTSFGIDAITFHDNGTYTILDLPGVTSGTYSISTLGKAITFNYGEGDTLTLEYTFTSGGQLTLIGGGHSWTLTKKS